MAPTRILIADDDPLLRTLLQHKLTAAGYGVSLVADGAEALSAIDTDLPDIVVLDAMMPVLDGFEVLRRLKADPKTASLPVVMLTALKREADIVSGLQLGAADYLVKPFIPDELVMRLKRLAPPSHGQVSDDARRRG